MTDKQPNRVLLIGRPGPIQEQITTAFERSPDFILAEVLPSVERLSIEISAIDPDMILIDSGSIDRSIQEIIDELSLQYPTLSTIALLPDDNPVTTQQVMLAGARAFLIKPFTQVNLMNTLSRVSTLDAARKRIRPAPTPQIEETERPLQTVTVFSPKGGVGCSTIATNLAISHYKENGGRVLLMEGKMFFGHLDVSLNILTGNSIADLVPHTSNLDDALIKDVVQEHASGINVLIGPRSVEVAEGIRADSLFSIFRALRTLYDFIVIDAGSSLNENSITLLDSADRILVVTTPELTALHDTSQFIQMCPGMSIPLEKILVVVNRAGVTGGVRTRDIENSLRHEIFVKIPDDEANAIRSINRGVPLVQRYGRSPASRAIKRMADQLSELRQVEVMSLAQSPGGGGG